MSNPSEDLKFNAASSADDQKRDEVIRRMAATPHKPQKVLRAELEAARPFRAKPKNRRGLKPPPKGA